MYAMLSKVNLIFSLIPFKGRLAEIKIEILVYRLLLSRGLYHMEIRIAIRFAILCGGAREKSIHHAVQCAG